jgi:hypothetical protein
VGGHVQQADRDDGQDGAAQAAERPVPDGQRHQKGGTQDGTAENDR